MGEQSGAILTTRNAIIARPLGTGSGHMSENSAPPSVKGIEAQNPTTTRKTSNAPQDGASAHPNVAIVKTAYDGTMTTLLPKTSLSGAKIMGPNT